MAAVDPAAVVYVIGLHGRVKIGTTTRLDQRLKNLQAMMPEQFTLVGTRPGGRKMEAAWHREFHRWRVHGEWFELPPGQLEVLLRRLDGEPRVIPLPKVGRPPRPRRLKYKNRRQARGRQG